MHRPRYTEVYDAWQSRLSESNQQRTRKLCVDVNHTQHFTGWGRETFSFRMPVGPAAHVGGTWLSYGLSVVSEFARPGKTAASDVCLRFLANRSPLEQDECAAAAGYMRCWWSARLTSAVSDITCCEYRRGGGGAGET